MYYVEILVADSSYHGKEGLTYASQKQLAVGSIVSVSLRQKHTLGLVVASTTKPKFAVKEVIDAPILPALPLQLLELLSWMRTYYPSPLGIITHLFLPKRLPKKQEPLPDYSPFEPSLPPLTTDQQQALKEISPSGLSLLHGETGTGKTRVYVELAARTLANGKSSLILTPEIGLTSQLEKEFKKNFGERVVVIHSQLSDAIRQKKWRRLLESNEPLVVIGPRSILFSPLKTIGLIVVDEAHENAYKQDQAPYYHATRVASKLASLHHSPIIIGSATPSLVDYYIAEQKYRPIVRMRMLATTKGFRPPLTEVVDLKDRTQFTQQAFLSNALIKHMSAALERKEQILLFLNRRGTARVVFCDHCGWQAVCPNCDVQLVYHGDTHLMRCHSCDYQTASPSSCPMCNNPSVVFKSIGTKAITAEVSKLFPKAKIQRFDTDNTHADRIEQQFEKISRGEIDIIIGTQTLAKGLDLPNLSVVGVIIADTSLYFPDFTAQERTYQLLGQVIGRVGRGHREGIAIIQTYAPKNPILSAVLKRDWAAFYKEELTERRKFAFPPFSHILKLTCKRATRSSAQRTAESFGSQIIAKHYMANVEGPAPAFHERIANKYHWQLIIKSKRRDELLRIIAMLPSGWSYDIDPLNLL
jgi:primosomal protein N' (replication factor Y) (superfamily II helicase)